jgi:hypothetical protein
VGVLLNALGREHRRRSPIASSQLARRQRIDHSAAGSRLFVHEAMANTFKEEQIPSTFNSGRRAGTSS